MPVPSLDVEGLEIQSLDGSVQLHIRVYLRETANGVQVSVIEETQGLGTLELIQLWQFSPDIVCDRVLLALLVQVALRVAPSHKYFIPGRTVSAAEASPRVFHWRFSHSHKLPIGPL